MKHVVGQFLGYETVTEDVVANARRQFLIFNYPKGSKSAQTLIDDDNVLAAMRNTIQENGGPIITAFFETNTMKNYLANEDFRLSKEAPDFFCVPKKDDGDQTQSDGSKVPPPPVDANAAATGVHVAQNPGGQDAAQQTRSMAQNDSIDDCVRYYYRMFSRSVEIRKRANRVAKLEGHEIFGFAESACANVESYCRKPSVKTEVKERLAEQLRNEQEFSTGQLQILKTADKYDRLHAPRYPMDGHKKRRHSDA